MSAVENDFACAVDGKILVDGQRRSEGNGLHRGKNVRIECDVASEAVRSGVGDCVMNGDQAVIRIEFSIRGVDDQRFRFRCGIDKDRTGGIHAVVCRITETAVVELVGGDGVVGHIGGVGSVGEFFPAVCAVLEVIDAVFDRRQRAGFCRRAGGGNRDGLAVEGVGAEYIGHRRPGGVADVVFQCAGQSAVNAVICVHGPAGILNIFRSVSDEHAVNQINRASAITVNRSAIGCRVSTEGRIYQRQ